MSASVLQLLESHLGGAGLLSGYDIRYFRWTDAEADGNTPLALFRMAGSQGSETDFSVQYPDVQIILIDNPANVLALDTRGDDIISYVRQSYDATGSLYIDPLAPMMGPYYLDNGRPWIQLEFRLIVTGH